MKKRQLTVVVASALMVLAHVALPLITVPKMNFSVTMFKMLTGNSSVWGFILLLLALLVPLYLLLDVFREKVPALAKVVIPAKVASLLPIIVVVLLTFEISGNKGIPVDKGIGYYIYLLAAIVVAVLPYVKHPALED